jgi:hypothetical protein
MRHREHREPDHIPDSGKMVQCRSLQRVGSRSAAEALPKPDAVGGWRARQHYTGAWVLFTVTFGRDGRGRVEYKGRKWSVAAMLKGGWLEWRAVNGASATVPVSDGRGGNADA